MRLDDERRIRGFDGLRAIAFIFVFISHKFHQGTYGSLGGDGVMLFFALSGLLITRILARSRVAVEAGEVTRLAGLGRFYLRRSARIFPVYYATIGFFLLASLVVHFDRFDGGARLAMLLYATNIYVFTTGHWVGHFNHFWTLAIEEQFYLVFAPLLLFTHSKAAGHICVAFVVLGLLTQAGLEWAGVSAKVIGLNPMTGFGYLALGGLVGLNLDKRVPAWLVSTPAQAIAALILLVVPLTVLKGEIVWRVYAPAVSATAALLVLQIAGNQGTRFVAILETWPLRNLGRISYGCYVFHEFIHFYTVEAAARKFGVVFEAPDWISAPIELVLTISLATASWRYFERPIMAWAHRPTRKAAPAAA
ncbi:MULTISPECIES: acyltransferase family protein [unclassified Mesorhizobium]|uniref:acyltransferase family protein n=1 Tax=unclassified Mesorhizobium TaxID=325217 RepID=UPI001CCB1F6D|nr:MULTISPECIES: acyltransferase [unclassified Mesorhizobium]MBZ9743531.1 acyltransferase [Mesorhizobium sp. CO1-1-4]MBZ9806213.1 acyltransferase [Mesorhizobium sp. ES1-6]